MTGYEALQHSAAWLDLSGRGHIAVTGEDRARLLHAMSSNHIQQLQPGQGCYAFFLNAQGRILADAHVVCRPDHLILDTEPETREKLFQHLDKYIIADDVTLEDRTEQTVAIAVEGPRAGAILTSLGAPLPESPESHVEWVQDRLLAKLSITGLEAFRIFAPVEQREDLIALLNDAVAADPNEFRIARLEHGTPRYGEEITERYLPQETGQLRALHFSKGCYLGQEIVERVRSRAQIHRHLMRVEIDSTSAPTPGAKLSAAGKDVGEIVSAAFSPGRGRVAAMAYMKTEFAHAGAQASFGEFVATVC